MNTTDAGRTGTGEAGEAGDVTLPALRARQGGR